MSAHSAQSRRVMLAAAICFSGCGTYYNLVGNSGALPELHVYGGVRDNVRELAQPNGPSVLLAKSASALDMPFTAVGDTVTLPVTLAQSVKRLHIFVILDEVSGYRSPHDYKPQTVIRAVNALQPLGKKRALATIDEYLETHSGGGIFLVLLVLFDVPNPPGHMPRMQVGDMVGVPTPQDHQLLSRSPIVLHDDIPFLLGSGYFMSAVVAEAPEEHVRYFREHGKLRTKPLSPAKQPAESVARLMRALENEDIYFREEYMTKQARSLADGL
ncbi:MAG: YceK/YidQ family lipoprotein [Planctomycetaceae bacterium]|jgi:uncharacterized protein YceK|nr:YceK/YidQ family lipoprotein [Planctomycetaceae bacterium]MBT6486998.1 YceK/YidQ family lipoprotein [Planctomycetaceae bacterium]